MDGHDKQPLNNRVRVWMPENQKLGIDIDVNMGISGHYYVQLVDAKTGVVKQDLSFPNILTDLFMDGIGSDLFNIGGVGTSAFAILAVGTGNTTPSFTDTGLVSEVARTSASGGIADVFGSNSSPEYGFVRRTKLFTEGEANGTLRELGYFNQAGSVLMNRTLFKDSAGNPTTVIKTAEDLLIVTYEWRLSAPLNDVTGTVSYLNSTQSSSFTLRPQGVNSDTHWLRFTAQMGSWRANANNRLAVFSRDTFFNTRTGLNSPALADSAISTIASSSYVTGTYYRDCTYTLASGDGNYAEGISLLVSSPWSSNTGTDLRYMYQMLFTPVIPKTDVRLLTVTLRYSWSRV
jgi:hypothetical protein